MQRALLALFIVLAAASCGGSPSAPLTPGAGGRVDFSGFWQGSIKYTQCEGMRHCFAEIGRAEDFTVRVQQSGTRAAAVFTFAENVIALDGNVLTDGTLALTGSSPFGGETTRSFESAVTVTRFAIRLEPGAGLAGTIAYEMRANQSNSEFALAKLTGDIVNTTRRDLGGFAATVEGTWKGRLVVRSCVPIGNYCHPYEAGELGDVELRLTQAGSQVAGTMKMRGGDIPVTGELSGRSLTLAGETLTAASGGPSLTRITAWNTSVDAFGRMSGTFEYVFAFPASAPALGSTARAELWQVVKMP